MSDSIFIPHKDALLLAMEEKARKDYIPIIKAEVGQFLQILIKAIKPRRNPGDWHSYWLFNHLDGQGHGRGYRAGYH